MPNFDFKITIKYLDIWTELDKNWNYMCYILCEIADKLYLLEQKLE